MRGNNLNPATILEQADNALFNLIVNHVNDIIAVFYNDGWCQYISPSVRKVLGYSEKELIGKSLYKMLHPDDIQPIKQLYEQAVTDKGINHMRMDCRVLRQDGNYVWLQNEISNIRDEAGNYVKTLVIARDITCQKRREKMQDEHDKRRQYFEKALSSVGLIIDEDGRFIEVFGQSKLFLSKPVEELKGIMLHEILPVKDAEMLLRKIKKTIQTSEVQQSIYELELEGKRHLIEGRSVPIDYLADGKKTVASVVSDVTAKRQLEKKLELTLLLKRRTELFTKWLHLGEMDESDVIAAKIMGLELFAPVFCCLVHHEDFDNTQINHDVDLTVTDLLSSDPKLFVWNCRGDTGILLRQADFHKSSSAAEWIMKRIKMLESELKVTIGIGGIFTGMEGIRKSYRQAASALIVARGKDSDNQVCHFNKIGIYQFLEHFRDEVGTKEFVQRHIGQLLMYDNEKGMNLISTLEEILRSSTLKEAAEKLYLHYNTLVFRKRRIEKILNVSIDDYETRLALATAIKLHWLLAGNQKKTKY